MRLSENRKLAFAALALCVALSVFGLGGLALSRERAGALKVFDQGTDAKLSVRSSMDEYLDSAAEAAQIMAAEAELHLSSSEAQLIDSVSTQAEATASDAGGLDARYAAYTALKSGVEKLYNRLYGAVQASDFKNFKLAYDDFWGYDDLIKRDDYRRLARRYNALASGFPGGLVALATGQGLLNTFGG